MTLREIIGQAQAVKTLQNALQQARVAHAYLFYGPYGVGKYTVAMAFAQALQCAYGDGDGCGQCAACRSVSEGTHPDLHLIQPEGQSIKLEQIKQLQQQMAYRPYRGNKRIFVIREAERMTVEAANSLLKNLEEPPPYVVVFLLTENLPAMLPTVVSRCQCLPFYRLAQTAIEEWLKQNHHLPAVQVKLIAQLADGSLGRAVDLMEAGQVDQLRRWTLAMVQRIHHGDELQALQAAEEMEKHKEELDELLNLVAVWYRDCCIWQATRDAALVFNQDCLDAIRATAASCSELGLAERMMAVEETRRLIRKNVNARLALEVMCLKLRA